MNTYKYRINFSGPKNYVFRRWLFNFNIYGNAAQFVRVFGVLIQRYRENEETFKHPITGSRWTKIK